MSDCLFCKIAAGRSLQQGLRGRAGVRLLRHRPPGPPISWSSPRPTSAPAGISPENSAVVAHAFEVISRVTKELGITDFRVVSNCGEQAGQSVHHLHFHVLAGRDMTWPPG